MDNADFYRPFRLAMSSGPSCALARNHSTIKVLARKSSATNHCRKASSTAASADVVRLSGPPFERDSGALLPETGRAGCRQGEAFSETVRTLRDTGDLPPPRRPIAALQAGGTANGYERGKQSAALVIYGDHEYCELGLRADENVGPAERR